VFFLAPSNVKDKIERKSKNFFPNYDRLWVWRLEGIISSDFYCKRHILAWFHVIWTILPEDRLVELGGKTQKVTRKTPIGMRCRR